MLPSNLNLTLCPRCQGTRILKEDNNSISCPDCYGQGLYLLSPTSQRFLFKYPDRFDPLEQTQDSYHKTLRYTFGILSIGLCLTSLCFLVISALPNLLQLLWQNNPWALPFGISGLLSMWAIATFSQHQTSEVSLLDLKWKEQDRDIFLNQTLNPRTWKVLGRAAYIANNVGSEEISDLHLLSAILEQSRIQMLLLRMDKDPVAIQESVQQAMRQPNGSKIGPREGPRTLSLAALARCYFGLILTLDAEFPYLDLEDLFLSYFTLPERLQTKYLLPNPLLSQLLPGSNYTGIFEPFGLDFQSIYNQSRWLAAEQEQLREWRFWEERGRTRPKGYMNRAWTALPTPTLDQYSRDITQMAQYGAYASMQVRKQECQTALDLLGSSTGQSVVIVGEPGAGTDSVLTYLATLMLEERVPEPLKDKRMVQLDIAQLFTSSNQNSEKALQQVINEAANAGNVILVIPEMQNLFDFSSATLDAAAILANALQNKLVQIITTADFAAVHRYLSNDSLLASQFQQVILHPLTQDEILQCIEEVSPDLERKYQIAIKYNALTEAALQSENVNTDKAPPGNTIDLLNTAFESAVAAKQLWIDQTTIQAAAAKLWRLPSITASGAEADKLLNLESLLHKRIVGQDLAVKAVSEALRRARAGLHNSKRPLGSFLFVGPTGVGKTELAKAISDIYFGSETDILRLDMSEYQDGAAIYKLIGSTLNAEERGEGGILTRGIIEKPFRLILLDELEKAHPDVLNLFLQILDDGRATENTGRSVSFKNAIIIATSNAGSSQILDLIRNKVQLETLNAQMLRLLESYFKPEFLNRFDGIIPFTPLDQSALAKIADLMLKQIATQAKANHLEINYAPGTIEKLISLGTNPEFGARPLRRVIEQKLEGIMAKQLLSKPNSTETTLLTITPEMLD